MTAVSMKFFDPEHTWKRKTITNFTAKKISRQRYSKNGKRIYGSKTVSEIQKSIAASSLQLCGTRCCVLKNPHEYYVDLSQKLWDLRHELLSKHSKIIIYFGKETVIYMKKIIGTAFWRQLH